MQALLIILLIQTIYFFKIREQLAKDKGEKRFFILISSIAVGMSLLVFLNVPIDVLMTKLNETLGDFTKQVIKL